MKPQLNCFTLKPCQEEGTLELFLPVPIPLSTAPSLTPEALVLLVGALWGARLGRNRHLARTTKNRFMTFTGTNSCKNTIHSFIVRATALKEIHCKYTAAVGPYFGDTCWGKMHFELEKNNLAG